MSKKSDSVELERRIRIVQEWLIDDWHACDIIAQIKVKWNIEERQAKRYIADARERWKEDEQELMEQKRRQKLESLRKLKRQLEGKYKGTPTGIRAVLAVEKEIIKLEGLKPPEKRPLDTNLLTDLPITFE